MADEKEITQQQEDDLSEREILERLARWVVVRRMTAPAIIFLESHRPLSFIGSQAMVAVSPIAQFFEPFFRAIAGTNYRHALYTKFSEMLEDRDMIERLIIEIERQNQDFTARRKEEKRRLKELKREAKRQNKALRKARKESVDRGET